MSFSALAPLWDVVAPPLRPSSEDLATFRRNVRGRTLVLGATDELLELTPEAFGVDVCEAMIERRSGRVRFGNWTDLPLDACSVESIFGDGSLSAVGDEEARTRVLTEIRRVLAPDGVVVLRTYTRPKTIELEEPETIDDNVNALKVWLWGRVADPRGIVLLDDVWRAWRELPRVRRGRFSEAQRASIECYEGSRDSYWVPLFEEMSGFFERNGFVTDDVVFSISYPFAERCPLSILRRRP